jgi:hypothetical protein
VRNLAGDVLQVVCPRTADKDEVVQSRIKTVSEFNPQRRRPTQNPL